MLWNKSKQISTLSVVPSIVNDNSKNRQLFRINQLPVSVTRWQHESRTCIPTFLQWGITKLWITQQPMKEATKYLEFWEFQKCFDACLTRFINCEFLLNKICHQFPVKAELFSKWKTSFLNTSAMNVLWNFTLLKLPSISGKSQALLSVTKTHFKCACQLKQFWFLFSALMLHCQQLHFWNFTLKTATDI